MEYVVDVQGFKNANTFVFKEVAIVTVQEDAIPVVCRFKPPCKWTELSEMSHSINQWLEYNFHGIPWSSGEIPYAELQATMKSNLVDARRIFVKGLEKKKWLQNVLPNKIILNLDDLGCPAFHKLPDDGRPACTNHRILNDSVCAVKQVRALQTWLLQSYSRSKTFSGIADGVDEVDDDYDADINFQNADKDVFDEIPHDILHSMFT